MQDRGLQTFVVWRAVYKINAYSGGGGGDSNILTKILYFSITKITGLHVRNVVITKIKCKKLKNDFKISLFTVKIGKSVINIIERIISLNKFLKYYINYTCDFKNNFSCSIIHKNSQQNF